MSNRHDLSSQSLARPSGAEEAFGCVTAGAVGSDPLSDVLRAVRLTGALYFLWRVSWPYVTPVPAGRRFAPLILPGAQQIISYHIVTEGSCWGGLIGEPPVRLESGDILLIPQGDAYVMSSSAQTCASARPNADSGLEFFRRMAAGEVPFVVTDGGGDPATRLVCGFLGCDVRPFNPILAALPRLVHLRGSQDPARNRLQSLLELTLAEAREGGPGSRCMLVRLSELMFVEVVRRCLTEASTVQGGWLAALRDPVVGRALMQLHRFPGAAWTLERLATEVGTSRSRLAESFTRLVGQPPMQYVTQWRMQIAARMLVDSSAKVVAVAQEVGYESEAAFSRAFKRLAGLSPAQWRRQALDPASTFERP
jgi:AraC-like DNA-binding protein